MLALIYWFISIMWSLWWLRQAFYTGLSDPKLFAALILGSMWLMICTSRQMRERRSTKRTNIIRGYLYYCVLVLMQTATLLISSKYHFGVISVVIDFLWILFAGSAGYTLREYRNDKFEKGSVVLIDKDNIGKNDANSFVMGMINKYKGFGVYQVSIIPDDRTTQYFDMDNTDISEFMLSGNNVVDLDESLITPMDFADKELNCVIRYPSDMPRVSKADIEFLQELTKNDSLTQSELNRLVALKEKLEYFDTSRDV